MLERPQLAATKREPPEDLEQFKPPGLKKLGEAIWVFPHQLTDIWVSRLLDESICFHDVLADAKKNRDKLLPLCPAQTANLWGD